MNLVDNALRAKDWLDKNSTPNFVYITDKQRQPYEEVTGYFTPTLKNLGFHEQASAFADFLVSVQRPDGWWGLDKPYLFDTVMAIEGLLEFPEHRRSVDKALLFVKNHIVYNGRFVNNYTYPMSNHLYARAIWVLRRAGFDTKSLENTYFISKNEAFTTVSQFSGYAFEAFARMGYDCTNFIIECEKHSFLIPESPTNNNFCLTGLSQTALSLFLCGVYDGGMIALKKAAELQSEDGGFLGSVGGSYFPTEKPTWAVKFFLDACLEATKCWCRKNYGSFLYDFEGGVNDPRLKFISQRVSQNDHVLDVGTGRGRYIRNISCWQKNACDIIGPSHQKCQDFDQAGVTMSNDALCTNLPYLDNTFDKIICAEAMAFSIFHENAINEMLRVVKPGGSVLIIEKTGSKDSPWLQPLERWPDFDELSKKFQTMKITHLPTDGLGARFVGVEVIK